MRALLSPRWLLSHLFALFMTVTMIGLGFWQLNRLDHRRALNADIQAASQAAPLTIEELLDDLAAGQEVLDQRAVTVSGQYRQDLVFLVANRTFDTRPGNWLAMPVELADGRLVVVARGWVPRPWVAETDPSSTPTPDTQVEVQGRVFASVDGGRIGTSNNTFAEVSRLDLPVVSELLGTSLAPLWVQLETQIPTSGELPIPVPPPSLNDGPHLSYAFQWFFFATGTVVVYGLILRRRIREVPAVPSDQPVDDRDPLRLLLAVRLRSRGTRDAVLETATQLGSGPAIGALLDDSQQQGWVSVRGEQPRYSLTVAGDAALTEALSRDLDPDERDKIAQIYAAFESPNRAFLAHCARWGPETSDAQGQRRAELDALLAELRPLLGDLTTWRPRFGSYQQRFDAALGEAATDPAWIESPRLDSIHTVWFELHEHLLATLGRQRATER
jgi:surfeit locus 1 family protein